MVMSKRLPSVQTADFLNPSNILQYDKQPYHLSDYDKQHLLGSYNRRYYNSVSG